MFENGDVVKPLEVAGAAPDGRTETQARHRSHLSCFARNLHAWSISTMRRSNIVCANSPFLNSGVRIELADLRGAEIKREELFYEGGLEAFVRYLDRAKTPLVANPILIKGERDKITVEAALWWNDSYHEHVLAFTNNIPQRDGGTHLAGLRAALTRQVTGYAERAGLAKREKVDLTGDDCREGLTCVLSVKVPDPKFSSQTKEKLVSSEVRPAVEGHRQRDAWAMVRGASAGGAERRRRQGGRSGRRPAKRRARPANSPAARARSMSPICPASSPTARSAIRRRPNSFSSKGDSAGGSAKQGRNREYQAVLPLRGKILNVERARFDKMLSIQEIGTLITALGTGIGRDDFNVDKLRYHKIIIMTDADVDGSHIRTLISHLFLPADARADRTRPSLSSRSRRSTK